MGKLKQQQGKQTENIILERMCSPKNSHTSLVEMKNVTINLQKHLTIIQK